MPQKSKTSAHLQDDSDVALNVIPNLFSLKQLREVPHGQGVTLAHGKCIVQHDVTTRINCNSWFISMLAQEPEAQLQNHNYYTTDLHISNKTQVKNDNIR